MQVNGKKLGQIVLLLGVILIGKSAFATTYYVDYSSGNDSNSGTSKTAPWQHAPGMTGATDKASSTTINPGDSVILKGGVTWPAAAMQWTWSFSGASGKTVYVGVDQTWYSGSGWTRPVLNAGGTVVSGGSTNTFLSINAHYVTFDNIEFTGAYWANGVAYGGDAFINPITSTYLDIKNCYFHGWVNPPGKDNGYGIVSDSHTPSYNVGTVIEQNVFDGSDTAEVKADPNCTGNCYGTMIAFWYGPIIRNNVVRYVSNGYVGSAQEFSGNLIEHIRVSPAGNHENSFENNTDPCTTGLLFFNNVIRHGVAVNVWLAPQKGCTPSYAFNNVVYDTSAGNVWDIAAALTNPYGTQYTFNNTIEGGPDSNPTQVIAECRSQFAGCTFENNHFITNASSAVSLCGSNCASTTNLTQTKSAANSSGYTAQQTNAFSPTSGTSPTVGKGTNLSSSLCSSVSAINAEAGAACQRATSYGVVYNATGHTATVPAVTLSARTSSGSWSMGAYSQASSTSNAGQVQPPSGLAATVQ